MSKKRIDATLYMESKIDRKTFSVKHDPSGFLFAKGKYRTKILPKDLPEYFVHGYLYKQYGYISAKGVKHLVFMPNYSFANHLHKDDILFMSYGDKIELCKRENGMTWYQGFDELVGGPFIEKFVNAAEKHSQYDVSDIKKEIQRKQEWHDEQNP